MRVCASFLPMALTLLKEQKIISSVFIGYFAFTVVEQTLVYISVRGQGWYSSKPSYNSCFSWQSMLYNCDVLISCSSKASDVTLVLFEYEGLMKCTERCSF